MGQVKEEEDRDGSNNLVKRQTYDYDKNGNRITHEVYNSSNTYASGESLTYNAADQLGLVTYYGSGHSTVRTQDFSTQVDANGNLAKGLGTTSSATSYVESYFPDGKVKTITDGGSHTENSCYSADGLLCTRDSNHYTYDGKDVVAVWSPSTAEERMHGLIFDAEIGSTYSEWATHSSFVYWHYDPLGNLALTTTYGGTVSSASTVEFYGTNPSPSTSENNYQAASGATNRTDSQIVQTNGGGVVDPEGGVIMQSFAIRIPCLSYAYDILNELTDWPHEHGTGEDPLGGDKLVHCMASCAVTVHEGPACGWLATHATERENLIPFGPWASNGDPSDEQANVNGYNVGKDIVSWLKTQQPYQPSIVEVFKPDLPHNFLLYHC
jgi:hypothetical protein